MDQPRCNHPPTPGTICPVTYIVCLDRPPQRQRSRVHPCHPRCPFQPVSRLQHQGRQGDHREWPGGCRPDRVSPRRDHRTHCPSPTDQLHSPTKPIGSVRCTLGNLCPSAGTDVSAGPRSPRFPCSQADCRVRRHHVVSPNPPAVRSWYDGPYITAVSLREPETDRMLQVTPTSSAASESSPSSTSQASVSTSRTTTLPSPSTGPSRAPRVLTTLHAETRRCRSVHKQYPPPPPTHGPGRADCFCRPRCL